MDVFQGLPSNTVPLARHHGKIKEISLDIRKKIVDLCKSGSSLGAISKCLKVPRSSVQTIVCKYNTMGPHSRDTAQERDAFYLLEMNLLLK